MLIHSFTRRTEYSFPTLFTFLLFVLLLLSNKVTIGNTYYFSSSLGDDTRTSIQARNPATPWKTITKLNSFFSSLVAGDSVLFKCGDVFQGTITPTISGTLANPIVISAYGSGSKPIISGFQTVSGWTNEGSGIYSKAIAVQSTPNIVSVNGKNQPLGRFPKSTYLTINSHVTYTSVTNSTLNSSVSNWTGAQVVIRKEHWIYDRCPVTLHLGSTISYTSPTTVEARDGFGFFFQNDLKCLTEIGDWAYLSGKLYMYFGAANPDSYIVNVSTIDKIVNLTGKNYISIVGLSLQGGNTSGVYSTGSGNTVKNCDISFIGDNGVIAWTNSNNITVDGCTITQCQNRGVYGIAASPTIKNNTIRYIALIPGMGGSSSTTYTGISLVQAGVSNSLVEYNRVDSIGYIGINFSGSGSIIRFNYVSNYCSVLDDGGGIYTAGNNYTGRKILNNIVINNSLTTASRGSNGTTVDINGIYLDNNSTDIKVISNTSAFNITSGIYLHGAHEIELTDNTAYGNGSQILFSTGSSYDLMRNNNAKGNVFFSPVSSQYSLLHASPTNDVALLGSIDSNYYCRPLLETTMFKTILNGATSYKTSTQWKTYSSLDAHSSGTPIPATEFLFEYATFNARTIPLSGFWKTLSNENISGTITLQPFTSIVLVKSTETNQNPIILNQSYLINENSANGTTAGTVFATDPDAGQTLTYSIVSGNTNGAFAINASTGVLTVANASALNFELTPAFALIIKVQDNGTGTLSSQATITVSLTDINEVPVIVNQALSLAENTINGTFAGTVTAVDPDKGQTLSFSIISGNTTGAFAINAATGALYVVNASALNFEVTPTIVLGIKVQDNGTGALSSQATLTISLFYINEPPVINNQIFAISENAVNEATVGTVIATDPNAEQTLTFSITSGNIDNAFAIDALTGKLTINDSVAIDYNINPVFFLGINVMDNGSSKLSDSAIIFVIIIPGPNQAPIIKDQTLTLNQNSTNGTLIGIVDAMDPDSEQLLSYSILSGNSDGIFVLNSATGEIFLANANAVLSDSTLSFALLIKVEDNGPTNLSNQAVITIKIVSANTPPVLANQTISTTEHQPIGTIVGNIIASDSHGSLQYSIISGNISNGFAIDKKSGCLTINNPAVVCFEGHPVFNLSVKVEDTLGLSSEALITINVVDINEKPVCNDQIFMISENAPAQTFVGAVIAKDFDFNQTLTYSIVSGNSNNAFTINPGTGVLSVNNPEALNFEETEYFTLVVSVQDNGQGNLTAFSTITVGLLDVNEAPIMDNQALSVVENSAPGTKIGYLKANDPDKGQKVKFMIVGGNESHAFNLSDTTGLISVADPSKLSYGHNPLFALTVMAQDNGTDPLSALSVITINLLRDTSGIIMSQQEFSPVADASNEKDISVYPNPTRDIININLEKFEDQPIEIQIFSITGSQVYSAVSKGDKKVIVDMGKEHPGTYMARIKADNQFYTKSIVVQN